MSNKTCRICSNHTFNPVLCVKEMMFGTRKEYKYYQCTDCGVLQIEEPVYDSNLLYPSYYYSFSSSTKSLKNKLKKLLFKSTVARELGISSLISKFIKIGESKEARSIKPYLLNKGMSILDVGCGSGELIEALFSLGYENVSGIDPFLSEDINHNGWEIRKAYIIELNEEKKYDLIMLHHSFEHMDNPEAVLSKIKKLLSANGLCIIRIPVSDSYAFEVYKENWVQLDAPRHVFLHTNKSMKLLAEKSGLKVDKITDDSGSFQFIASEQYKKGISLNAPNSFYRSFYKKLFSKTLVTKEELNNYNIKSEQLNNSGKGDQRVFVLSK